MTSNTLIYNYHFRPCYNSEELLIEIFSNVENDNFLFDLLNSICEINPKVKNIEDLWMNDEMLFNVNSNIGSFIISKDIWGIAFIMSDENQECLYKINSILLKDEKFEKIEVNFEDYK